MVQKKGFFQKIKEGIFGLWTSNTVQAKPTTKDAERWKAQSWLLDNIPTQENIAFDGILNVAADPHLVLSTLHNSRGLSSFVEDISNSELSSLVPYIKLFRVIRDKKKVIEQELYFDTHLNNEQIDAIFKKRTGRGGGVGIKKFDLKYTGVDPAAARTVIECDLEIYFSSLQELARKQSNNVAFIDLILPNIANAGPASQIEPQDYQLKAEFGWSVPNANNPAFRNNKDLLNAIENNKLTIYLSMKRHTISFDNLGGATLQASYQGSMESIFSQEATDILKSTDNFKVKDGNEKLPAKIAKNKIKKLKADRKKQKTRRDRKDLTDQIRKLEGAYQQALSAKKSELYQSILNEIMSDGGLYAVKVEESDFQLSTLPPGIKNKLGGAGGLGSLLGKSSKKKRKNKRTFLKKLKNRKKPRYFKGKGKKVKKLSLSGSKEERLRKISLNFVLPKPEKGKRTIYFMYLGDILRVVRKRIGPSVDAEFNFRLITGDLELSGYEVNISNIPISVELFQAFTLKYLVRTSKTKWFFGDFINQILTGLVAPVLNNIAATEHGNSDKKNPVTSNPKRYKMGVSFINVGTDGKNKCVFTNSKNPYKKNENRKFDNGQVRKIKPASNRTEMITYLYVHCMDHTRALRERNYQKDREEGIYHFYLGSNRGILKSMKFEQQNLKYYEVAQAQGKDLTKYKRIYNATIETFYCNGFFPGNFLYLDSRSLGFSEDSNVDQAAMMGIGGYFRIKGQSISFASGKLDMTMNCTWESSGLPSPKGRKAAANNPKSSGLPSPKGRKAAANKPESTTNYPYYWKVTKGGHIKKVIDLTK